MMMRNSLVWTALCCVCLQQQALLVSSFFIPNTVSNKNWISLDGKSFSNHLLPHRPSLVGRKMNFLKDLMDEAFRNDDNLDNDKRRGQYDGPNDVDTSELPRKEELTETQRRWREKQSQGSIAATSSSSAPLVNSRWTLDFYLTGVPERDPSNDLFGSKVNISSRDRAVGLTLPEEPTVQNVVIELQENGVCKCVQDEMGFTSLSEDDNILGEWKLSDDGKQIRFSIHVLGYRRRVETTGSIQKVYWSQEDERSRKTSTEYNIPTGFIYGDATLSQGSQVNTLKWNDGILRVEQTRGLFGAGSNLVPCGRFTAREAPTAVAVVETKQVVGEQIDGAQT